MTTMRETWMALSLTRRRIITRAVARGSVQDGGSRGRTLVQSLTREGWLAIIGTGVSGDLYGPTPKARQIVEASKKWGEQ